MIFEFATATRIIFGEGTLSRIGSLASESGKRAFIVAGLRLDRLQPLLDSLAVSSVEAFIFQVNAEPTVHLVSDGLQLARQFESDLVIGCGGGSAIDTGKAIAALYTNPGEIVDYLEVIGKGKLLVQVPLPYIAIPTTAGTGSEVTRNAVLGSPEHKLKVSLRSPLMLPHVALVDPQLTYNLPPDITASTGLDALTQVIEPFVSKSANALTDAICRDGIKRAARSLLKVFEDGKDPKARQDMSLVSLFGGFALANAKLGAVHGFASPLGGMFSAPHGALCARLLPFVMQANLRALQSREPSNPVLDRYREVASLLTGKPDAPVEEGVEWMFQLSMRLSIPPLSDYGIQQEHIEDLAEEAGRASSMQGNPIRLTSDEMHTILLQAL